MSPPTSPAERTTFAPSVVNGLKLLVVEDDEADAYLISRALSDNPAVGRILRARDGIEALDMVGGGDLKPDLAFIDLHMPRMNGFELLVAFSNYEKVKFPMVVLTSSTAQRDAVKSRLRNAMRVVVKPENLKDFYGVLQSTIEAVFPAARRGAGPSEAAAKPARFSGRLGPEGPDLSH